MKRAGANPLPAAANAAKPVGRAYGAPREVANDNRQPLAIILAKAVAVIAAIALAALAALTI
jgi:hypothetical protein